MAGGVSEDSVSHLMSLSCGISWDTGGGIVVSCEIKQGSHCARKRNASVG